AEDANAPVLGEYHEVDLLICETLFEGHLDDLNAAEMAGLVSCFCFRTRASEDSEPYFPSKPLEVRFQAIARLQRQLNAVERSAKLLQTAEPDPGFLAVAHGWALGGDVADVLRNEAMAGGDFVRTMKMLIDLLRQLGSVAPDAVASTARSAAEALDRGLVQAVGLVEDRAQDANQPDGEVAAQSALT
ncbi:MAG: hypothetical protein ACC652_12440, partial [Acidimicrobiales bacterium]